MDHNERLIPQGIKPFPDTGNYEIASGDRHDLVTILQIMLDVLRVYYDDFDGVCVDGVFDEATCDAIKSFQKTSGLPQSGCVDVSTWNRLAEEFNAAIYENQ